MYGIIYKVLNINNNKIYIGQTIKSLEERKFYHYYRANNKLNINTHFINALRKYPKTDFIWSIIDTAETKEELNNKEIYWIKYYDSINNGYNIQQGGNLTGYNSDEFALACGAVPFLAYRTNGEFLGEYINQTKFSREYNIAKTHVSDLINNKLNSCNGFILIKKENFSKELLQQKMRQAKQTFRPFIAIKMDTLEYFGPYSSPKECKQDLKLSNPHITEVLKKQRKSGEGYLFKFCDELEDKKYDV